MKYFICIPKRIYIPFYIFVFISLFVNSNSTMKYFEFDFFLSINTLLIYVLVCQNNVVNSIY